MDIGTGKEYVPGHVMISFEKGIGENGAKAFAEFHGVKILNWTADLRLMLVEVAVGEEQKYITEFMKSNLVASAELNGDVHPH